MLKIAHILPLATIVMTTFAGCAALTPIKGVSIDEVDPALLDVDHPRTAGRTIDLSLLGQPRPQAHVVDSGDVLGIFIEGVLGREETGPPVINPSLGATPGALMTATVASAKLGFPITVRDDGQIALPYRPAISVRGLTLGEVELKIRETYTGPDGLLKKGRDRIFVTLHKPRTVRVLVVRKDRPLDPAYINPPDYRRADDGRGTAVLVELPAFENDVLHALVASGGLPGPDAENSVYVMRAGGGCALDSCDPANGLDTVGPGWSVMPSMPMTHRSVPQALPPSVLTSQAQPLTDSGIVQCAARVVATAPVSDGWLLPIGHSLTNPPSRVPAIENARPLTHLNHPYTAAPANRVMLHGRMVDRSQLTPAGYSPPWPQQAAPQQPAMMPLYSQPQTSPVGQTVPAGAMMGGPIYGGHGVLQADPYAPTPYDFGQNNCGSCDTGCDVAACGYDDATIGNAAVRKIPLNLLPGETPNFNRSDILLNNGDILLIEGRSKEYFYTAGLLGGGKYPMPRDEDTDLLDAIAIADSQRRVLPTRHIGGVSSLNQDVTIGASRVIIFRPDGHGGTVPIQVKLNKIKRDPSLAPVIKPGDRIVLQYTKFEAIAASLERHFLEGTVLGIASGVTFGDN